ncbi:hypothetical protein [Psychrobacillus sp. L3]
MDKQQFFITLLDKNDSNDSGSIPFHPSISNTKQVLILFSSSWKWSYIPG